MTRCGTVSILGRPNAGKSTLLNALLGQKLAIVSSKPQTTRTSVQGVLTLGGGEDVNQIIFLDTPGIHTAEKLIHKRMMKEITEALDHRDLLVFVADAQQSPRDADLAAIELVRRAATPVFLVLNKVDRLEDKRDLLPRIEKYKELHEFEEYFPISALKGTGLDDLRRGIAARMPEGPALFPEDYLTDQPERFFVAELLREKVLRWTREEVPHAVAVLIENWEETGRVTRVAASIVVERPGQKAILLGSGGEMMKRIATEARLEIEQLLDRKVFLEVFVKVRPDWRDDAGFLGEMDWRAK
jgi:GTP-binding protein Era